MWPERVQALIDGTFEKHYVFQIESEFGTATIAQQSLADAMLKFLTMFPESKRLVVVVNYKTLIYQIVMPGKYGGIDCNCENVPLQTITMLGGLGHIQEGLYPWMMDYFINVKKY